jgi:DNA-binding FadR family transcriptional regulator
MLEFRMLLEPRMSALAALNASDDDIVELEYLCGYVDELIMKGEDHLKADMEYHTKIARCSRNLLMPKVLPIIHSGIGLFISETMNKLSQETMLTHRAVLDAIKLHDPIAASDAMTMHLMYNRCMLRDARRNENPQSH